MFSDTASSTPSPATRPNDPRGRRPPVPDLPDRRKVTGGPYPTRSRGPAHGLTFELSLSLFCDSVVITSLSACVYSDVWYGGWEATGRGGGVRVGRLRFLFLHLFRDMSEGPPFCPRPYHREGPRVRGVYLNVGFRCRVFVLGVSVATPDVGDGGGEERPTSLPTVDAVRLRRQLRPQQARAHPVRVPEILPGRPPERELPVEPDVHPLTVASRLRYLCSPLPLLRPPALPSPPGVLAPPGG